MIRLAGLEPDIDVEIKIVGLRPGEKLYEELFDESEQQLPSALPGIFEAQPNAVPLATLNRTFDQLDALSAAGNAEAVCALARALIGQPEDQPTETFGEPVKAAIISARSEEHTSELQSLMRNSYAVFCLKKKKDKYKQ